MPRPKNKAENHDVARDILESAIRVACAHGMGGVTARAVAIEARVAPSAVIYYFKSIAGLLNAIHDHVEQDLIAWRAGILDTLTDPAAGLFSPEALGIAALSRLVREMGPRTMLQQELRRAALRGTLAPGQPPVAGFDARAGFWRGLWRGRDLAPDHIDIWGATADGLVSFALLDRAPFRRDALIASAMRRVDDRLAGRPILPVRSESALPDAPHPPAVPRGKRQITEAAMRLIGREGVDRLTHRKIAVEAGLSLAATTYFYASKDDLIADAFREIQRQVVYATVKSEAPREQFVSAILLDDDDEERWQMAGIVSLYQVAVRSSRFDDLAMTLRQMRGIDGMRWLQVRGLSDADQLDGIIWSAVTSTIAEYALCLPRPERRAHLDRQTARSFETLFGIR